MTLRLLPLAPLAVLIALPLGVFPDPPVSVVAAVAGVVAGAGALLRAAPLATAGAVLTLVDYAVALLLADARPDPARGVAMGLALVLFLAATHLALHAGPAALRPGVLRALVRHWIEALALGAAGAAALALAGQAVAGALHGAALPIVTVLAAGGALLAAAGVIASLLAQRGGAGASP
jgi:hypothetical protein